MKKRYRITADGISGGFYSVPRVEYCVEETYLFGWVKVAGACGLKYEDAKRIMAELENGRPLP